MFCLSRFWALILHNEKVEQHNQEKIRLMVVLPMWLLCFVLENWLSLGPTKHFLLVWGPYNVLSCLIQWVSSNSRRRSHLKKWVTLAACGRTEFWISWLLIARVWTYELCYRESAGRGWKLHSLNPVLILTTNNTEEKVKENSNIVPIEWLRVKMICWIYLTCFWFE